ncbi:unnamed protein product, partial [Mesorhabditis spiculigera]
MRIYRPTCTEFDRIQTQCSWTILADSVEVSYNVRTIISSNIFGVSVRVLEWIDPNYTYHLLPEWADLDDCDEGKIWFSPMRIITFVPIISIFLNFDSTNGTSFLEAYHGGDPGNSQINAIATFNANVRQMGLFSFSSATTLVNRNSRGLLGTVVGYNQVELVSNTFVPLQYTQTYLNSWKYPWVFEEDQVLFPETTMKLGRLDANPTKIKFSRQTGYNGTGGFKVAIEPQSAYTSDTFAMDITTVAPNYMFNIVDLLSTQTRFLAVFPKIDVQANVALTVCSLDDDSTPTQHMAGFVNCVSSANLTTRVLNCCTRIEPVSNGSSILMDVYNFTYYNAQPSVVFSVELAKNNKALVLSMPFDAFTDDALAVRVPSSEKTVFFVVCLASHHFRKRADEIETGVAVLTAIFWPHSLFDCEYRLYTGMVTAENTSRPLTIFRNADIFYPIWLFAGTYTLEIPAGCMPTISLGTQQVESVENIISTDCIGSRLIVSPNFNMMPINAYSGVAENITWICTSVDISLELISLIYGSLDIYFYHLDGSTEMRSYNLSQPTARFKATEITMLTVFYGETGEALPFVGDNFTSVLSVRPCMGNKTSRGERASNHVAFSVDGDSVGPRNGPGPVPNIVITQPTPIDEQRAFLAAPSPRAPPSSPARSPTRSPVPQRRNRNGTVNRAHDEQHETRIMAGTPPPEHPPPPPPHPPPEIDEAQATVRQILERLQGPFPPAVTPRQNVPTIKQKPVVYSRPQIPKIAPPTTNFTTTKEKLKDEPIYKNTRKSSQGSMQSVSTKYSHDSYPIYNPVQDFGFSGGKPVQTGGFPIETNRINIGFCGRLGSGKSHLINALRGIDNGAPNSAGRYVCDKMEPFRFVEVELQHIVIWEIPYPRSFTAVVDVYDQNMGFERFYDAHQLQVFKHLFVLIPDGALHDDDIAFSRVLHSRRTPMTILSTKSDDDLDAESRENRQNVGPALTKCQKAPMLLGAPLLFVSAPVVRNLLSNTIGFLHYKLDEDELLKIIGLAPNCHLALENRNRREKMERDNQSTYSRSKDSKGSRDNLDSDTVIMKNVPRLQKPRTLPQLLKQDTVLADSGFEILFATDDRPVGNYTPKSVIESAARTVFNYGFIGGYRVGKSAMINAMRGLSSKHPFAAGREKTKPGACEKYEFSDDLLKYGVTLWELHYPKKINGYFEFIDFHNLSSFTAIFILTDGTPSDEDLSFAKIAHRRNATVVFLSSKTDKRLTTKSRADEIPVCDILKQRYVDKGLARFDAALANAAPELCGRVHCFFVSAPVFRSLRCNDRKFVHFLVHERAVFDFLKQKRIISEMLESPMQHQHTPGSPPDINAEVAGVVQLADVYANARE